MEIAVKDGSAARELNAQVGDEVVVASTCLRIVPLPQTLRGVTLGLAKDSEPALSSDSIESLDEVGPAEGVTC